MKRHPWKTCVVAAALAISVVGAGLVQGSSAGEVGASPSSQELDLIVYAAEDAYIKEEAYDENNGSTDTLVVGRTSAGDRDILLKFDLSGLPSDAVVQSATLKLWFVVNAAARGQAAADACNVTPFVNRGTWQEMAVTWNNAPVYNYNFDPASDINVTGSPVEWDVTNSVDDWERGVLDNHGFRLVGDRETECARGFQSREGTVYESWRPQLHIVYTSESSTATPTATATHTPTPTSTPTPPGSGSCPGIVYVYPDADTFVDAAQPSQAYGHEAYLSIYRESVNPEDTVRQALLHFPIEAMMSPGYYVYDAWLVLRWSSYDGSADQEWWRALAKALEDPFDESATNWTNRPTAPLYGFSETFDVYPGGPTAHVADLTELVREWYSGATPNHGISINPAIPLDGYYRVDYHSRESSDVGKRPYLRIECGDEPPTPTPTPTETPTPTASPTPTVTPTPIPETADVRPLRLEVTQGVQNQAHVIPLLEGKRTYVRVPYDLVFAAPDYAYSATAKLRIYRGGWSSSDWEADVLPINNGTGYIELVEGSDWRVAEHSFIFELPSQYTSGEINLEADIDPDWELPEGNRLNNEIQRTISFVPSREYDVRVFLFKRIAEDGTITQAHWSDFLPFWDYARAALPFADVNLSYQTIEWHDSQFQGVWSWLDDCVKGNLLVSQRYIADDQPSDAIYYGFAPEWIRGCSADIPASVATSSVDDARSTVAHELGHCFGRHHTQNPRYDDGGDMYNIGCGANTGCWYSDFWGDYSCVPGFEEYAYSDGSISPHSFDVLGFYHNDYPTPAGYWTAFFYIPNWSWKDLMTYCNPEVWPGDFTWLNIYEDFFEVSASTASEAIQTVENEAIDSLVAIGTIYSDTGAVVMLPPYVVPDVTWAPEPTPGDYAIVLRDASDVELVRHPFTPGLVDAEDFGNVLSFGELVPYAEGTVRVDIEGPTGVLTSATSGPAAPTVTVIQPNGGETLSGETALVRWTADDPDGDPLYFNVQYSADDGATWSLVASNVFSRSVAIDTANMPASRRGRMRVLATDGIHTGYDSSDRAFTVPNHRPNVEILAPQAGARSIVSQTVALRALVYDVEDGSMEPSQLRWSSNLDGVIGRGAEVSVAGLTPGRHRITLDVEDSDGASNSDSVQITVYEGPDDLPTLADELMAEPGLVVLNQQIGVESQPVYVYNQTNTDPIEWTAEASEPWVELSAMSGTTPETLIVSVDSESLPNGRYTGAITFTAADNPRETATVNLSVTAWHYTSVYLPLVLRSDP